MIKEGTWAAPYNERDAERLRQAMKRPMGPEEYKDQFDDVLGSDELYDRLRYYDKGTDIRHVVADYIRDDILKGFDPSDWEDRFDDKALRILRDIARKKTVEQLDKNRLQNLVREELQKLTELGIDRGFLNGFAEELENITGNKAYPKDSVPGNEDVVNYNDKLDIYFRSGGARGGRADEGVNIQILDRSGRIRSGFTAPNSPDGAAERTAEELSKINESGLRHKLQTLIREEINEMVTLDNMKEKVGVDPKTALQVYSDVGGSSMKFTRKMKDLGVSVTDASRIKDAIEGSYGDPYNSREGVTPPPGWNK